MLKEIKVLKNGEKLYFFPNSLEDRVFHILEKLGILSLVRHEKGALPPCIAKACCNTGFENLSKPLRIILEILPI